MNDLIKLMLSRKAASFVALCIAITGVFLSTAFQKFGDFVPCKLCLMQRSLLGGTAITLCIMHLTRYSRCLQNLFFWLSTLLMLSVFLVSLYQVLIQYEFVAEPSFCHMQAVAEKTVEELLEQINNTYTSPCKAMGPTILGFPISVFSCLGTFFASLYLIFASKN